jgi:hypothetical protein
MNNTVKGLITVGVVGGVLYFVLRKNKTFKRILKIHPSFETMREELWNHLLKSSSKEMANYKDNYFKTNLWNDKRFITDWYLAFKNGDDLFNSPTANGMKQFRTKDGIGV